MKEKAQVLVGEGRKQRLDLKWHRTHRMMLMSVSQVVVDPKNLCTVFVSPRQRAHKTFHLLFGHLTQYPHHILTEEVREWDYGNYASSE